MLKRDEIADPNSCLNKAADDEPIFVLRANDPKAANAVRNWAAHYRLEIMQAGEGIPTQERHRKILKWGEACRLADQMEAWRAKQKA